MCTYQVYMYTMHTLGKGAFHAQKVTRVIAGERGKNELLNHLGSDDTVCVVCV